MPSTNKNKINKQKLQNEMAQDSVFLVFVIDDEVVDILTCNEKFAAILQSSPKIIELDIEDPFFNGPKIGWKYTGKDFYPQGIEKAYEE
jgi:hypothetical protein